MITLFRRIRQKLIDSGSITKYLLYAVGEILLVVIGILIALQVNNWNEERKERKLESRYITQLVEDIRQDSINIAVMKEQSDLEVMSKRLIEDNLDGNAEAPDSLRMHFNRQWGNVYSFNYVTRTIDEMTSSGNLDVIRDQDTRETLLLLYNDYDRFRNEELNTYLMLQQARAELFYQIIPEMYTTDRDGILKALDDFRVENHIRGNSAYGLNDGIQQLFKNNQKALSFFRDKYGL